MQCGLCLDWTKGAAVAVLRTLDGRRRRVILCAYCDDFLRARRRL